MRAATLQVGRQSLVPARPPNPAPAAAVTGASAPTAPSQPLNLNTATLEQLDTLDGVGPATAQKILDYRTEHGGFSSVDELDQIPGIGEKRLAPFPQSGPVWRWPRRSTRIVGPRHHAASAAS